MTAPRLGDRRRRPSVPARPLTRSRDDMAYVVHRVDVALAALFLGRVLGYKLNEAIKARRPK